METPLLTAVCSRLSATRPPYLALPLDSLEKTSSAYFDSILLIYINVFW